MGWQNRDPLAPNNPTKTRRELRGQGLTQSDVWAEKSGIWDVE